VNQQVQHLKDTLYFGLLLEFLPAIYILVFSLFKFNSLVYLVSFIALLPYYIFLTEDVVETWKKLKKKENVKPA
jgi:hypothetical protein